MCRSGGSGIRQGYETALEPGKEVHAREAGPLLVRREQRVAFLGLHPAPPERGRELCHPEITREAVLVPPESLEADDADRPGAEAALAVEPQRDRRAGLSLQAFEVEGAAEPDERRRAAGAEPEARELRGGVARQILGRRSSVQIAECRRRRLDDAPLDPACFAR